MTKTGNGTVHFSVADDTGVLIMNIAQEHLLYNYSPSRAIASIKNSLTGCPDDLALKILKGDMVIYVESDENTGHQEFMVSERNEFNDTVFPNLQKQADFFITHNLSDIIENGRGLQRAVKETLSRMKYREGLKIIHSWKAVLSMTQGIDEEVLEEIRESEEYQELKLLVEVVRDFITKSTNVLAVMSFMDKVLSIPSDTMEALDVVARLGEEFGRLLREDYTKIIAETKELESYIESAIEMDKIVKKGIEPVDIMDNYSAGWLSPDGIFYGMNGEIANMLHNNIATALQEAGQIPMYVRPKDETYFFKNENDKPDAEEVNPDSWLEQQGWVKVHGNNIQFAGCLNTELKHLKLKNVDMTETQVAIIKKYIQLCHGSIISVGWKREKVSASMFELMATNNMSELNKRYFKFS